MFRLALLFLFALVLCILPGGYAGPACTRKYYQTVDCVQKCSTRWGYPGSMMGSNPWGVVMQKVDDDSKAGWKSAIAEACGMTTSSSTKSKSKQIEEDDGDDDDDSPEVAGAVGSDPDVEETSVDDDGEPKNTATLKTLATVASKPTPPVSAPKPTTEKTKEADKPSKAALAPPPAPPKTTPKPEKTSGSTSPPANQGGDIGEYLKGHNDFRRKHGASALTWNDNLASKAQQWANGCIFEHSKGTLGKFGENLAAGTGSGYTIASAIKSWTDESKDYDPNNPSSSHFTQVVWKNSKQVGCALQLCDGIFEPKFGKAKFVVCEYDPPGNFNNDFARNVQV